MKISYWDVGDGDIIDTDWHFVTQPQAAANGRELHYTRGKCLCGPLSEVGIPLASDFTSGTLDGAKIIEITVDPTTHLRESSQTSFLDAAAGKSHA